MARTKLEAEYTETRDGYRATLREIYVNSGATKRIVTKINADNLVEVDAQARSFIDAWQIESDPYHELARKLTMHT